jgi:DNA invertase Pin-like site-specific DNA recombinase
LNFGDNGSATGQLLFQIIGAIAEFERALMLERQREAIAAAKAAGTSISTSANPRHRTD